MRRTQIVLEERLAREANVLPVPTMVIVALVNFVPKACATRLVLATPNAPVAWSAKQVVVWHVPQPTTAPLLTNVRQANV